MTSTILHLNHEDRERDLYAEAVPWGRHGMSIGRVEDAADTETLRLMVSEALALAARLTEQLRRAEAVIIALRTELRARRAA